jgi:mannose-6-phosphate isomerase-like protein (cupin superfamily)
LSRTYTLETGTAVVRLTAEDTGGLYSIIEYTAKPGHARYLHVHHNMEEAFLVISGEGTFQVEDRVFTAGPGEYVLVKRDVPHNIFNQSDADAVWLEIYTPPGFEQYLEDLAQAAAAHNGVIPLGVRAGIIARHDIERVEER